jgi:16S rRNA (guanine966-N2)-methyltransferase
MCAFLGNSMLVEEMKVAGKTWMGGGEVRVIAGIAKGRRLQSVRGQRTRPTADRVKESLFSILGDKVTEGWFLDLYAGSGAIGIEALSRGASGAIFVENRRAAVAVIHTNLRQAGFTHLAEVYHGDVGRAIAILAKRELELGCIFMDPPYGQGQVVESLMAIGQGGLAGENTLVIAEHGRGESIPDTIGTLRRIRVQRYGDTEISFFAKQNSSG